MSDSAHLVWTSFDELLAARKESNPWRSGPDPLFEPDLDLLRALLNAPEVLLSKHQTGLPAKALDVFIAAELRRAGFAPDAVWPRASEPRVAAREVAVLVERLPKDNQHAAHTWIANNLHKVSHANATILGRAYYKQVDVVVSHWSTGPEILISTKRVDTSLSNNASNRIEESYGDVHNLRGRHPLAAIGYVMLVDADEMARRPRAAERLVDHLERQIRETGGYDAAAIIVVKQARENPEQVTSVELVEDAVAATVSLSNFFAATISAVLSRTPPSDHKIVRELLGAAQGAPGSAAHW